MVRSLTKEANFEDKITLQIRKNIEKDAKTRQLNQSAIFLKSPNKLKTKGLNSLQISREK